MTSISFLPAARLEFLAAVDRYETEVPGLGSDFIADVEAAGRRITAFRDSGSPHLAGTRRIVLKRFPFSVVYSQERDVPLVVAVSHHRQKPGYWLDRVRDRR